MFYLLDDNGNVVSYVFKIKRGLKYDGLSEIAEIANEMGILVNGEPDIGKWDQCYDMPKAMIRQALNKVPISDVDMYTLFGDSEDKVTEVLANIEGMGAGDRTNFYHTNFPGLYCAGRLSRYIEISEVSDNEAAVEANQQRDKESSVRLRSRARRNTICYPTFLEVAKNLRTYRKFHEEPAVIDCREVASR